MRFRAAYNRALAESKNVLSDKDYAILLDAYRRPNRNNGNGDHVNLIFEVEKEYRKRGGGVIINWLKANWLNILKLILALLPLFLMIDEDQPQL
jgi:hypothetical protein